MTNSIQPSGILLVNKPRGLNSFKLVSMLRKRLNVQKIGHAGTLDPFATGVMVMLIGREYTRLSDSFLNHDKEYIAEVKLGVSTDSYDCDGQIVAENSIVPSLEQLQIALKDFQGEILQIPPMFSAKKIGGKKLYELARKGKEIDRPPAKVRMETQLLSYNYPFVTMRVACSKGTYIRSIAHDLGNKLGCGAHLTELQRIRSGPFKLEECLDGDLITDSRVDIIARLQTH